MNQNFVSSPFVEDFKRGMLHDPKTIPPKYFYDDVGSRLFDQICDLPEYYPTRAEDGLLKEISHSLVTDLKPDAIYELGSGTARKTRRIFDACESVNCFPDYYPIDVCPEILITSKEELCARYDWLSVHPMIGDYMKGFSGFKNSKNNWFTCFYWFFCFYNFFSKKKILFDTNFHNYLRGRC